MSKKIVSSITILMMFLILISNFYLISNSVNLFSNYIDNKTTFQINPIFKDIQENISPYDDKLIKASYADEDIPFNITSTGHEFDGYNLFVLQITNISDPLDRYARLLITDMNGNIVNKLAHSVSKWAFAHFINSTTVLFLSNSNTVYLWNVYTNTESVKTISDAHHDITFNDQTNTYLYIKDLITTINDITYQYDQIVEEDESGNVIWSLNTTSFIPTSYWNGFEYIDDRADITHTNTAFWDFDEDVIFIHPRNLNTFYKINHSNSEVLWGLGEYGNFTMFNQRGEIVENLFYHGHAVEKIDDNKFIVFDNDYFNTTQTDMNLERESRIVEIIIDETSMTANESWSWVAPRSYFSRHLGDADLLPNSNRLGLFGAASHPNTNIGARLVEVDEEGNIDWEMNFPNDDYQYDIYQTERIRFSPVIENQEDIYTTNNNDVNVTWQTWYNFRTKREMNGFYEIYLNDSLIDSKSHMFDKFWRPTNLTINLGKLSFGTYNLTLILYDEEGFSTIDMLNITCSPFYVFRYDPDYIEKGQSDSEIIWSGDTMSLLDYEIKSNESTIDNGDWLGGDITLDGSSLSIGKNFIQFVLYNNSILVYNDSFWFPVYPPQDPLILSSPEDFFIPRNQSSLLSWSLFDYSPNYYEIYLDNTLIESDLWINQSEIIEWDLPLLTEGTYNLTLIVYDQLLQSSSVLTWVTVMPPSPPIISYQSSYQIIWGEDTNLTWEVFGGHTWTLYKNQSFYQSEPLSSNVTIKIDDWYSPEWHPGNYNLTLVVEDIFSKVSSLSIILKVVIDFSDPYIDSFIESHSIFYLNGENIIDAPDLRYASIYSDYSNGYITGDMGEQEEILDGLGDDFEIIATGGEYQIWVGNDLNQLFTLLSTGTGNMTFDLATISFSKARYIRIEYRTGGIVNVDAVVAINFNQEKVDSVPPEITGPDDILLPYNQTYMIILNWIVYDETPYNYSISINNIIVESNYWNGSDIYFECFIDKPGIYNVTLYLNDIFNNKVNDTVVIEVLKYQSFNDSKIGLLSIGSLIGISAILVIVLISTKKYRKIKFTKKFK